ncbi:MAG: hypothetical protein ACTS8R_02245 [Arsenophonus sp. NC-QC1-MAG3]
MKVFLFDVSVLRVSAIFPPAISTGKVESVALPELSADFSNLANFSVLSKNFDSALIITSI